MSIWNAKHDILHGESYRMYTLYVMTIAYIYIYAYTHTCTYVCTCIMHVYMYTSIIGKSCGFWIFGRLACKDFEILSLFLRHVAWWSKRVLLPSSSWVADSRIEKTLNPNLDPKFRMLGWTCSLGLGIIKPGAL